MSEHPAIVKTREETPVDDVRRIRCRLSLEAGGDIRKLIEASREFAEHCRDSLGLKTASPLDAPRRDDEPV